MKMYLLEIVLSVFRFIIQHKLHISFLVCLDIENINIPSTKPAANEPLHKNKRLNWDHPVRYVIVVIYVL